MGHAGNEHDSYVYVKKIGPLYVDGWVPSTTLGAQVFMLGNSSSSEEDSEYVD